MVNIIDYKVSGLRYSGPPVFAYISVRISVCVCVCALDHPVCLYLTGWCPINDVLGCVCCMCQGMLLC